MSTTLRVFDASTPADPVQVGLYTTSTVPIDMTLAGNYLYLTYYETDGESEYEDAPGGVRILDVSDPEHVE